MRHRPAYCTCPAKPAQAPSLAHHWLRMPLYRLEASPRRGEIPKVSARGPPQRYNPHDTSSAWQARVASTDGERLTHVALAIIGVLHTERGHPGRAACGPPGADKDNWGMSKADHYSQALGMTPPSETQSQIRDGPNITRSWQYLPHSLHCGPCWVQVPFASACNASICTASGWQPAHRPTTSLASPSSTAPQRLHLRRPMSPGRWNSEREG